MGLTKVWTAVDRLSFIWKSDLSNTIKHNFFQIAVTSILLYGCTIWTLTKRIAKKLEEKVHKNATSYSEQILEATSHETAAVWPPTFYH